MMIDKEDLPFYFVILFLLLAFLGSLHLAIQQDIKNETIALNECVTKDRIDILICKRFYPRAQ